MIGLFQLLFYGHIHKWVTINRSELTMTDDDRRGVRVELQCLKCGEVKKVDLI